MTPFWFANFAVWLIVLVIALRGAVTAALRRQGTVRRGDPMRLAVALVASLFVGYPARWMWAADSVTIWKALNVIGVATAIYVIRLMFAYGRGAKVEAPHG